MKNHTPSVRDSHITFWRMTMYLLLVAGLFMVFIAFFLLTLNIVLRFFQ